MTIMKNANILYLDDDQEMRQIIKTCLPEAECDEASTVKEAIALIQTKTYSILLIDLNLKGESGFDFVEFIKAKEFVFMPIIIIITSSQNEEDAVRSHQLDVHDFITKPIKPLVFRAQIEKYLNKVHTDKSSIKKIGPLSIDAKKMQVKIEFDSKEEDLLLTLKEYKLLMKFIDNPLIAFTREQLYTDVWESSAEIESRTIDMHVSALRKKLRHFSNSIVSVRGIGYSFNPNP